MSNHTITVEKLRTIEGYENAHPGITAVVERLGSHVKVCATSKPVPQNRHVAVSAHVVRQAGGVRPAMVAIAKGFALSYGAEYVEAEA